MTPAILLGLLALGVPVGIVFALVILLRADAWLVQIDCGAQTTQDTLLAYPLLAVPLFHRAVQPHDDARPGAPGARRIHRVLHRQRIRLPAAGEPRAARHRHGALRSGCAAGGAALTNDIPLVPLMKETLWFLAVGILCLLMVTYILQIGLWYTLLPG